MTNINEFDLRPRIFYDKAGNVNGIETYTLVNGWTIASSNYRKDDNGNFSEQHFDEHHGIYDNQPRLTTQERMSTLKIKDGLSILDILNAANKQEAEALTKRVGLEVRL